jgi:NhaC family Na+:H+ antiporter
MESMLGSVAVIIFGLGFGGPAGEVGILEVIASAFEKRINSAGSLTSHTIGTAFLANVFGSAMYVSLILTPRSWPRTTTGWDWRKNLSRNAEFGGTLTCGMVPWSDNGIFMAGVLGVATLDYLPYMWLSFTCIIVTITLAYLGKAVNRVPVIEAASPLISGKTMTKAPSRRLLSGRDSRLSWHSP